MSKQLESIMNKVPRATPAAPSLSVVPQVTTSAEPGTTGQPEVVAPVTAPTASRKSKGEGRVSPQAAKETPPVVAAAEPESSISAVVPVSIRKAVIMRAASDETTVRGIILQGLKAIGFDIPEDLIRDRRK